MLKDNLGRVFRRLFRILDHWVLKAVLFSLGVWSALPQPNAHLSIGSHFGNALIGDGARRDT